MKGLRLALFLVCGLLIFPVCALAGDVYTVGNADTAGPQTVDRNYLCVALSLDEARQVVLSVCDSADRLMYQRDYGVCAGAFLSEDIYLPLNGGEEEYTVTVALDGSAHSFRVTRVAEQVSANGVCSEGLLLSTLSGARGGKTVTLLDTDALEGSSETVPLVLDGVQLGAVTFSVRDGQVSVSADLWVDGRVEKSSVYVAKDALTAQTLGTSRYTGKKSKLNRSISLSGTPYAAVLVQLTISYDPTTAVAYQPDPSFLATQEQLWTLMQQTTANEAVG